MSAGYIAFAWAARDVGFSTSSVVLFKLTHYPEAWFALHSARRWVSFRLARSGRRRAAPRRAGSGLDRIQFFASDSHQEGIQEIEMAAVDEKVKQIIVEQLQVDEAEVTPGASFQEDLGADSLDVVELVMQFEEAFDIQIPDEDAEKIKTVKDAVDYIEKTQKAAK